jgi:hypothetical protein
MSELFLSSTLTSPETSRKAVERWLTTGLMRLPRGAAKITGTPFVGLPLGSLHVAYQAQWYASVGQVDNGTSQMAMNQYEMAHQQWVAFGRQGIGPTHPAEADFVSWHRIGGIVEGRWSSGPILRADLKAASLDARVADWAVTLLEATKLADAPSFGSYREWAEGDPVGCAGTLDKFQDELLLSAHKTHVLDAIKLHVAKELSGFSYTRNISFAPPDQQHAIDWVVLPIYYVTYSALGKHACCVVEAIRGQAVVGKKVRSLRAAIARTWSKMRQRSPDGGSEPGETASAAASGGKAALVPAGALDPEASRRGVH